MLEDRSNRLRSFPHQARQSNVIAEQAIYELMTAACRRQPLKSGKDKQDWASAVVHAACRSAEAPHDYLGGEAPHEQLTEKPFSDDRRRTRGGDCCINRNQQQRGAGSKFYPYTKRENVVGKDHDPS